MYYSEVCVHNSNTTAYLYTQTNYPHTTHNSPPPPTDIHILHAVAIRFLSNHARNGRLALPSPTNEENPPQNAIKIICCAACFPPLLPYVSPLRRAREQQQSNVAVVVVYVVEESVASLLHALQSAHKHTLTHTTNADVVVRPSCESFGVVARGVRVCL